MPSQASSPPEYAAALQEAAALQSSGDLDAAIQLLAPWAKKYPRRADLHHRLGFIHYAKQDYAAAIRHLSEAVKGRGQQSAVRKQSIETLGLAYYFTRQAEQALPLLEKAVEWKPDDSYLGYVLAMCHVYTRDKKKATQAFARLYDVPGNSPQASLLASHFMVRENFIDEGQALIREAQEKQPNAPDAHYRLGVIALTNGKIEEAVEHFQKELAANPSHPMAWHYLGFAYTELGKPDLAVDPLQRAIWLNLRNTPSYILLASVHAQREEYSLAENALKRALELAPQSYEAHFQLARIYHKTNRPELAKKEMDLARSLRP